MNSPYDILFEPVRIGPVIAPNRFYQMPHCNGFGHRMPQGLAAMRDIKAEGGWGVVCTEEVEIHHSSDLSPYFEGRLWDDGDAEAPNIIAQAVFSGHLTAREFDESLFEGTPFKVERMLISP
jgi:dimethylamine/trimethylamine dehydrogenase